MTWGKDIATRGDNVLCNFPDRYVIDKCCICIYIYYVCVCLLQLASSILHVGWTEIEIPQNVSLRIYLPIIVFSFFSVVSLCQFLGHHFGETNISHAVQHSPTLIASLRLQLPNGTSIFKGAVGQRHLH